jgi:xylulose-5-phosphate/fructose-6-phosphate phosphoketolase
MDTARTHCATGASVWDWASTDEGEEPDIVLACAGDIPTMETLAAASLLRRHLPDLRVRVVNVVDLMVLFPPDVHPHGMPGATFDELFTEDSDVIVAFHGYARALHQILHGRTRPDRFHVHGYVEEGTTTTPFDMVVRNHMSRYDLVLDALSRSKRVARGARQLEDQCRAMLERHGPYVREHLEDMPEVRDWVWAGG